MPSTINRTSQGIYPLAKLLCRLHHPLALLRRHMEASENLGRPWELPWDRKMALGNVHIMTEVMEMYSFKEGI
jgi:hypothetical protein